MRQMIECRMKAPVANLARLAQLVVVAGLVLPPVSTWGLGRWPNDVIQLGDPRANAVVRVWDIVSSGVGTGTVIDIKPDTRTGGVWLCVLTADHVVGHGSAWQIGFGNIDQGWQYSASVMFRGPQNPDGSWVDLALLGVHVPNPAILPPMKLPALVARNSYYMIVAGFGLQGNPDVARTYVAFSGSYGVFRSGNNTIAAMEQSPDLRSGNKNYKFQSLRYHLQFNPANQWPPQTGTAHIFSGDSGGPSFQVYDLNGDGDYDDPDEWRLVGVHSTSERRRNIPDRDGDGQPEEQALEGYRSRDVSVWDYRDWIREQCAAVPEPASMVALAVGLLGLVARRRRVK